MLTVPYYHFRERSSTNLFVSRGLDYPFAIFDFESTHRDCSAMCFARSARFSAYFRPPFVPPRCKIRDNDCIFIALNPPHLISTLRAEPDRLPFQFRPVRFNPLTLTFFFKFRKTTTLHFSSHSN